MPPKGLSTSAGRRIADLAPDLRRRLSAGEHETRTWTEWMAVDTASLARAVATELQDGPVASALSDVAARLSGKGVLARLSLVGLAVSYALPDLSGPSFEHLARHRSDAVRQWGAYVVGDPSRPLPLGERLRLMAPFAADPHMSVRECAWMAFRPFLLARLDEAIGALFPLAGDQDPRLRRFAIEVSRPRSVWGTHCATLKASPGVARPLIEKVRSDPSRYVQLAAGNWINDASKTRPDWALALCAEWSQDATERTNAIMRRGLRTIRSGGVRSGLSPEQGIIPGLREVTRGG